jgi:hypothetical protein
MTYRNLVKWVIFCLVPTFSAAAFYIFFANPARASDQLPGERPQTFFDSKLIAGKSVYQKGETAAIFGTGFRQFEEVTIKIEQFDNFLGQTQLCGTWIVVADEKGNFYTNWTVPFEGRFIVNGTGSLSEQEAETSFTSPVTPVFVPGNPTCAAINASSDPAFAHITSDWGLKLDPPASGIFTFTNSAGTILQGGASPSPSTSVTVNLTGGAILDWSATRAIQAVIVKAGSGANVYPYNPFAFGDTGLITPGGHNSSHLVFCIPDSGMTAARVPVGGRVYDHGGQGLARTTLTIQNTQTSETRTVVTNSFGAYRFDEMEVGYVYLIGARNKKFSFENGVRAIQLNDAIENLDFKTLPR